MLLYCGGDKPTSLYYYNGLYEYDDLDTTPMCFAVDVNADGGPTVTKAASLPYDLAGACHGSDGDKLVIAGGQSFSDDAFHNDIIVL